MNPITQVCIYCASSNQIDQSYFDSATQIANILVDHDITIVFGGGKNGLMGRIADTVIERKGKIIGIIPDFMKKVEMAHDGLTELHIVPSMRERKKRFLDGTHALITLPGGVGTFEELLEAITLKKLGFFTGPIIILNQEGYYDPLLHMLEKCAKEHFMREKHLEMWTVIQKPEELMDALKNAPKWSNNAINFAAY